MPPVEVEESELATLQRAYGVLQKLANDPKSRPQLESAMKVHYPDIQTADDVAERHAKPVIERIEKIEQSVQERLDAISAKEKAVADAEADRALEESFNQLKKDGYTDDGINKIKQLMVDRSIPDPVAAAALFDRQNPPPPPEQASFEPSHWNYESNAVADTEALFENPDKWADKAAANILNEMRKPDRDGI